MAQVVVAIGSNQEREQNICAALDTLQVTFGELAISPVYESQAKYGGDNYCNLVVAFNSELPVLAVKEKLRLIEDQQARERHSKLVTLDLDLLLCGVEIGEFDGVVLPHHEILECAYVLRPLSDLLPQQLHPIENKSFLELWSDFPKEQPLIPIEFVWRDQVISVACPLPL